MSFLNIFSPSKIANKLNKTSNKISSGVNQIFLRKKLDADVLLDLEDLLITSDMGLNVAKEIVSKLKNKKFKKEISEIEIKEFLSEEIYNILIPCQKPLQFTSETKPQVIIFNGVNGAGKTTTIGKISQKLTQSGKKVMIAACDTFRAAATDQLKVWADNSNSTIIEPLKEKEDPASVAYRALSQAKQNNVDILMIDTAGRLQNKQKSNGSA